MIAVLLAFIGYQVYRIIRMPTAGRAALNVFNVVATVLTMIEYGRHRRAITHDRPAGMAISRAAGRIRSEAQPDQPDRAAGYRQSDRCRKTDVAL
jgi:hypothetical protein